MKKVYLRVILFGILTTTGCVDCRLRDLFNRTADNNIGQLMDTMTTLASNNINLLLHGKITDPVEELVSFWCGHGNFSELRETFVDDPGISSKLNFSKPIAFVTHGWTDDASKHWVQDIAQTMTEHFENNACVVQWKDLAAYSYEQAATENTSMVSEYLTKFVRFLLQRGAVLKDMILIGHSLGAHVMGQVGHNFNGEIGQIYGLDPARAFFTAPDDRGLQYRLDKTDAKYVQMIITTRGVAGVLYGDGHDNFYPDGGTNPQPNCVIPLGTDAEFANQLLCSHIHSTTLFRSSLKPWNLFLGNQCPSFALFLLGMCNSNKPNNMGIFNNRAGGDFYLRTSFKSIFPERNANLIPNFSQTIEATVQTTNETSDAEEIVQMAVPNFETMPSSATVTSVDFTTQTTPDMFRSTSLYRKDTIHVVSFNKIRKKKSKRTRKLNKLRRKTNLLRQLTCQQSCLSCSR